MLKKKNILGKSATDMSWIVDSPSREASHIGKKMIESPQISRLNHSGMMNMGFSHNAYDAFKKTGSDGDDLSIDDGINADITQEPHDNDSKSQTDPSSPRSTSSPQDSGLDDGQDSIQAEFDALRIDRKEMMKKFEEHMEVMWPLSEKEEHDLRSLPAEEKWKIVFNQVPRKSLLPVDYYITGLVKFLESSAKKGTRKDKKDSTLAALLRKLKMDLKMALKEFLDNFLKEPYCGMDLLVSTLRQIQLDIKVNINKKTKKEIHKRILYEEWDCLLCIKYGAKSQYGTQRLIHSLSGINLITSCLMSNFTKSRHTTLEILTLICEDQEGYQKTIDAFAYLRLQYGESVRFKVLVGMLHSEGTAHIHFQTVCVRFFNTLLSKTSNLNARVYLQHELHLAGFDPTELEQHVTGNGEETEALRQELAEWRRNVITIEDLQKDITSMEDRNTVLREELFANEGKIKRFENERNEAVSRQKELQTQSELYKAKLDTVQRSAESYTQLEEIYEKHRLRAEGLEVKVGKLEKKILNSKKLESSSSVTKRTSSIIHRVRHRVSSLRRANKPSDIVSVNIDLDSQDRVQETPRNIPDAPPIPTPPPFAPPLPTTITGKVVTPKVPLPTFNWIPLKRVDNTVFEEISADTLLDNFDFSEFEDKFHIKVRKMSTKSLQVEKSLKTKADKITFIESNRARNMIITKRRINKPMKLVCEAIKILDTTVLPGELAGLLSKYYPTDVEVEDINKYAEQFDNMEEAEQMMFQLTKVESCENRLESMAFMGCFADHISDMMPKLESIDKAAMSVMNSKKLKKVFEIILAFGNYMNSSKRGYVSGFKLETLSKLKEVKSFDKKSSLLAFMVQTIETKYSHLTGFVDDLDLDVKTVGATLQTFSSEITALEKGLDLIDFECQKQPKNSQLSTFYKKATQDVENIISAYERASGSFMDACATYGEGDDQTDLDTFFKYFADFVKEYKEAREEMKKPKLKLNTISSAISSIGSNHSRQSSLTSMASVAEEIASRANLKSFKIPSNTKVSHTLFQSIGSSASPGGTNVKLSPSVAGVKVTPKEEYTSDWILKTTSKKQQDGSIETEPQDSVDSGSVMSDISKDTKEDVDGGKDMKGEASKTHKFSNLLAMYETKQ